MWGLLLRTRYSFIWCWCKWEGCSMKRGWWICEGFTPFAPPPPRCSAVEVLSSAKGRLALNFSFESLPFVAVFVFSSNYNCCLVRTKSWYLYILGLTADLVCGTTCVSILVCGILLAVLWAPSNRPFFMLDQLGLDWGLAPICWWRCYKVLRCYYYWSSNPPPGWSYRSTCD